MADRAPRFAARTVGLGAGVGTGLLWGLAFLLPVLLDGWNAVAVTASRYVAYGLVSVLLLAVGGAAARRVLRAHLRTAAAFAVTGNVGYYLLLVIGVQTVGAPVTDMVIGAIPVTVAIVGNVLTPAYPWRRIILPVALVTAGLVAVNVLEIAGADAYRPASTGVKLAGLAAALAATAIWTWYAVANARFLAAHPEVPAGHWATAVGVATGGLTVALLPVAALTGQLRPDPGGSVPGLLAAAVVLGVVVSWGGTWLWNAASARLSPTVAGMLINVETAAGFGYVYAARGQWPPPGQLAGFAVVLAGVLLMVARAGDPTRSL